MAQTKIKAGLFEGIIGNGTDGYFLMSNGDGTMTWSSIIVNPTITSIAYPGSVTAADPAGGETITVTGTGFKTGATVTIGGTAAPAVSYVSATQITFTTPAKAAGDYDMVVTNTDTGSATYINGISYNGIPTWTTAAGSLGTFASDTTISTITLQATEPDAGTITFSITNGALPTGLSLTGANIDGTTTLETADTLYTFTVTATDDESQATPRTFTITVTKQFISTENFTVNTYTGNGSTLAVEGKIGTAAYFNGSSSKVATNITNLTIPTNSNFSISSWVKISSTGGFIFAEGSWSAWSSVGFGLQIGNDNKLELSLANNGSSGGMQIKSTSTLSLDTWYHVALTIDIGTALKIYINGNEDGTTSLSTNSRNNVSGGFYIGSDVSSFYFDGTIDQVRFFNKALSSSEVTTLYGENNTSTTKSKTDIFDDGSGIALYEFEKGAIDTGGVTGYIGEGGMFNGSSSRINTNDNKAFVANEMSISLWGKLNATGANENLISNWNSSGTRETSFQFTITSANKLQLIVYASNDSTDYKQYVSNSALTGLTSWNHFSFTLTSGITAKLYVNGSEVTTTVTDGSTYASGTINTTGTFDTIIGAIGNAGTAIDGQIDQVRIFNKALSSSEVTTLYGETSASATKSTTDIFDDGSGVALYELEGNANDTGPEAGYSIDGSIRSLLNGDYFDTTVNQVTTHSISFWAKIPTTTGAFRSISTTTNSSGDVGYIFRTSGNNNELQFVDIQSGATSNSSSWSSIESDQWKHFVIVLDSTEARIYENNVLKATVSAANVTLQNGGNIRFGAGLYYGSDAYLEYKHIRTYLRALNTTEINTLYNENFTNLNVISSPQSWFNFDNNSSGSVNDKTGSYTGTISGMTYTAPSNYDGTATDVSYAYDGTPTNVSFVGTLFQPDFVWIKPRSYADNNNLFDSIRGATKQLISNNTAAESTQANTLQSFDSNGFTTGPDNNTNINGSTYVAWAWKAGGAAVTGSGSNLTNIEVSANAESGFSIVKYTSSGTVGAKFNHGLNSAPEFYIIKEFTSSDDWVAVAKIGSSYQRGKLNTTDAFSTSMSGVTNNVDPTSTEITLGNSSSVNQSGQNYIAYCFHSVSGYSSIGSFVGDGSTDAVLNLGFEPRWIMIKNANTTTGWFIMDSIRDNFAQRLRAESSNGESSIGTLTTSSTGITISSTSSDGRINGRPGYSDTMLYIAFK